LRSRSHHHADRALPSPRIVAGHSRLSGAARTSAPNAGRRADEPSTDRHFLAPLLAPVIVGLNRSMTWRDAGFADRDETSVCEGGAVGRPVKFRRLARTELWRVAEIDRTERIDLLYEQRGTELVEWRGDWSSPAWDPDGYGDHSVEAQRHVLEHYVEAGGIAIGAFSGRRLVGIGVVVPHLRPEIAQLAYLHVSHGFRAAGIGSRLSDDLGLIARDAGDTEIVVSATPSENTVRFDMCRGYKLMAQPLPELFELEPEDVHMTKAL
jgi:GNAT superfamily N-acetyltransferase